MPLGIDVVFKWGSGKKKEEPVKKKEEPPKKEEPKPSVSKKSSCESSASCSCENSCESTCSTASRITGSASDVSRKSKASVKKSKTENKSLNDTPDIDGHKFDDKRLMIFVRHAERMDRVFPNWIRLSTKNGEYRAFNKKLPIKLSQRGGGFEAFSNDPPLSRQGQQNASALGKAFEDAKIHPAFIYCSPSLRCVETASNIAKSMTTRPKLRIEPGLFDYMGFYMEKLPIFMTLDEMHDAEFDVDRGYKPLLSTINLIRQRSETPEGFYDRVDEIFTRINKSASVGTVLLVCHASVLDAGARVALKLPKLVPTFHLFDSLHYRYPYSYPFILEQDKDPFNFKEGKSILPPQSDEDKPLYFDKNYLLRQE